MVRSMSEGPSELGPWRPRYDSVSLQVCRLLGRGAFGEVVLARASRQRRAAEDSAVEELQSPRSPSSPSTSTLVALKRANVGQLSAAGSERAVEEAKLLQRLGEETEHILRCFDFRLLSGTYPLLELMLEFAPLGDLSTRIRHHRDWGQSPKQCANLGRGLPEEEVVCYGFDIAAGLSHLHNLRPKVLHRDIKPANIVLFHGNKSGGKEARAHLPRAKLADFGIAKILELESSLAGCATVIGTPHYFAPELCRGEQYDERADAWALGCVLYEMLCLHRPFHKAEGNLALLAVRISEGKFDRDALAKQARQYNGLLVMALLGLLAPDQEQRSRANDAMDALQQLEALLLASCGSELPASTASWRQRMDDESDSDHPEATPEVMSPADSWQGADSWEGAVAGPLEDLLTQLPTFQPRTEKASTPMQATIRVGEAVEVVSPSARTLWEGCAPLLLPFEDTIGPEIRSSPATRSRQASPSFLGQSLRTEVLGEGGFASWAARGGTGGGYAEAPSFFSRLAWESPLGSPSEATQRMGHQTPTEASPRIETHEAPKGGLSATLRAKVVPPLPKTAPRPGSGGTRLFMRPIHSIHGSAQPFTPSACGEGVDPEVPVVFCFFDDEPTGSPAKVPEPVWSQPASPTSAPSCEGFDASGQMPSSPATAGWQEVQLPCFFAKKAADGLFDATSSEGGSEVLQKATRADGQSGIFSLTSVE
ncbi:unnamed protein product [Polarella glacialis]|uniref:non-specific serine/threonine protein kinase n=1 Tax=Polarella glacialis TaxID=89957 RepID=A0A813LMP5_POLGL|nr:unnamed protein product [Polarella glacialis]